jgi:glutamyl-tRNA reductase
VQLLMLGASHARAAIEVRERLAFHGDELLDGLRRLAGIAHEAVILSTCNRTEIYALCDAADGAELLRGFVARHRGIPETILADATVVRSNEDAVRHLFRVACGLDSMMLGEPQILTQVQQSLAAARGQGCVGPILTRLCHDALCVGKLARTRTGIARNRLSISHAAVDLAAREIGALRGRAALVLGAGQIGSLTAKVLRGAGVADLAIVNPSPERGRQLAADVGGRFVPLDALPRALPGTDVLFAAATAPDYLVGPASLAGIERARPLVMIDLGVPRNIEPALAGEPSVRLFSVDDLEQVAASTRVQYAAEVDKADALVDAACDDYLAWWRARDVVPSIAALHQHAEGIRRQEVERTLRKLAHLSERDRVLVEALATAIVNKLLHQPVDRIKLDSRDGSHVETERALVHLFGLSDG